MVMQDLSCLGRCALTVAIPALSALGVQCIPLPTAVLSTHTGGFGTPAVEPLTGYLRRALDHYAALKLQVDALLVGYLSGPEQVELALAAAAAQPDALVLVDPAMGDGGMLYASLPEDMPRRFLPLCEAADVILPNWTEACLLCGCPYSEAPQEPSALEETLRRLPGRRAVVTGVPMPQGAANAVLDEAGLTLVPYELLPGRFPGTGDLFAAVLTGLLLRGESSLAQATRQATEYLSRVIRYTMDCGTDPREGVLLEPRLRLDLCAGALAPRTSGGID